MIDLDYAVYSFVALFLIVDPITNVPVFHSLLEMYSAGDRSQIIG
ncbi:MAG: MarC family protein [Euryarchaeota archaeon]|nr:MarC family protein [Euryarchaeota archaeon]